MPKPLLALIADDLTGTLDAAAPFAARGLATRAFRTVGAATPAASAGADVVAVDTESRHLAAAEAAGRVRAACAALDRARPAALFKKIDSTLRGNVVAETLAALAETRRRLCVLAPAVPGQGRTVEGGIVHVHGTPLERTPFVHDPVSPASPLPLADQLRLAGAEGVALLAAGAVPDSGGNGRVWIADSTTDADLERLARWGEARRADILWVGAAGLAEALADRLAPSPSAPAMPARIRAPLVYLVGSRSATCARQAAYFTADCRELAVIAAPCGRFDGAAVGAALDARRHVLITVPAIPEVAPETVATALGTAAAALVRDHRVGGFVATGGDTAGALLVALGENCVALAGELEVGVPVGTFASHPNGPLLVTKAGAFGGDDLFARIRDRLAGAANKEPA